MAGKPGLSGRKSKAEEMGLKALLDDCIGVKDRRDLFLALKRMARGRGAHKLDAMKLLLAYLYGTPRQAVEVTGADGGPVQVSVIEVVAPGLEGPGPEAAAGAAAAAAGAAGLDDA